MSKEIPADLAIDLLDYPAQIKCPWQNRTACQGVPHLVNVRWGKDAVKTSTSGHGLILDYECEEGHKWRIKTEDHSGGTWLSVEAL